MSSRPTTRNEPEIVESDSRQDAAAVFDRVCRRELGISGEDFMARWSAGEYADVDVDEIDGLAEVVGALPFAC